MKILICICFLIFYLNDSQQLFINVYKRIKQEPVIIDPGEPLFLTPLIEQGKIKEAQAAAEVNFNGFKKVLSYSGYLTVNKAFDSNIFFWFFPSQSNSKTDPVILWLQGGPGATSLIGLFAENGPFAPKNKHGVKLRKYSWTATHSVLYIDNPVGAGYSFTNNGYAQNETVVAADLYEALLQIFQLFPDLQQNDFFISGESYAGKYVPAISYKILKSNPTAKQKINLKGLTIGNGFSDPINQLDYGDYLYQIGLIDSNTKQMIQDIQAKGIEYIKNKQWLEAIKIFDDLINGDLNNHTSVFKNITGFSNYFNYLIADTPDDLINRMGAYVQKSEVRKAIHVGNSTFNGESSAVEINLVADIMQSVTPWITELLNNYRVLVYNGQLDIIVAYPLTVNYLKNLQFDGADQYKTAKRVIWHVGNDVAGYAKVAGNLTEVLVRDAGHMVPADQPLWAFDLISRFTQNKPYN